MIKKGATASCRRVAPSSDEALGLSDKAGAPSSGACWKHLTILSSGTQGPRIGHFEVLFVGLRAPGRPANIVTDGQVRPESLASGGFWTAPVEGTSGPLVVERILVPFAFMESQE